MERLDNSEVIEGDGNGDGSKEPIQKTNETRKNNIFCEDILKYTVSRYNYNTFGYVSSNYAAKWQKLDPGRRKLRICPI